MRISLALALLGACSSPPATACHLGELRTCSCPSGSMSSQACTASGTFGQCLCDSQADSSVPIDGGTGVDADQDASMPPVDAFVSQRDSGPHDGGTDAGPPVCSLVAQTGCGAGEACRRTFDGHTQPYNGPPACFPAGSYDDWGFGQPMPYRCFDGSGLDLCQAGLFCMGDVCARFCEVALGCPADAAGEAQDCVLPGAPGSRCAFDPCCMPHIGP